jgi:hypothetical protein
MATEFLLMNIMNFGHYSMITFAYMPLSIFEFKKLLDQKDDTSEKQSKLLRILTVMALSFVVLIASARTCKEMKKLYDYQKNYSATATSDSINAYKQLVDIASAIPDEDKDEIIGYGTNPWFYLDLDITPACKYFVMQDWQAEFSDDFKSKLLAEFEQKKPKWIILCRDTDPGIQPIIDSYYEEQSRQANVNPNDNSEFVVYRLK